MNLWQLSVVVTLFSVTNHTIIGVSCLDVCPETTPWIRPWQVWTRESQGGNPIGKALVVLMEKSIVSHRTLTAFVVLCEKEFNSSCKLKADQPHPCDYPQMPTDCRHTDNDLGLVIVVVALCCTRQSRALTDGRTDGQTDGRYQFYYLPASPKLRGR